MELEKKSWKMAGVALAGSLMQGCQGKQTLVVYLP